MNGLWWLVLCLCLFVHVNMVLGACTKTQNYVSVFVYYRNNPLSNNSWTGRKSSGLLSPKSHHIYLQKKNYCHRMLQEKMRYFLMFQSFETISIFNIAIIILCLCYFIKILLFHKSTSTPHLQLIHGYDFRIPILFNLRWTTKLW